MKASDISDDVVFRAIDEAEAANHCWATIDDVHALVPDFPRKVVWAKCAQMIRKGRIDGCPCGCRGDLTRIKPKPKYPK